MANDRGVCEPDSTTALQLVMRSSSETSETRLHSSVCFSRSSSLRPCAAAEAASNKKLAAVAAAMPPLDFLRWPSSSTNRASCRGTSPLLFDQGGELDRSVF